MIIEAMKALVTLAVLAVIAKTLRVEKWLLVGLWAFMAVWALRAGIPLFRSTHRKGLLLSSILMACGAACGTAMYAFWSRPTFGLMMGIGAAALMSGSLVLACADWRRKAP